MNTAAKGRRHEHRSRDMLEALGYTVVRAAASRGTFDLVALGPHGVILLQIKSRDWPGEVEIQALRDACPYPYVAKLIHRYRDGVRQPDVREL